MSDVERMREQWCHLVIDYVLGRGEGTPLQQNVQMDELKKKIRKAEKEAE